MSVRAIALSAATLAAATLGVALSLTSAGWASASAKHPFDGAWTADVVCPRSADEQGYAWRLPVQIAAGTLSGTYHSPTTEAQGELSGWVRRDGAAIVSVVGVAGTDPTIGHVEAGTRFRYTANVHFSGDTGSGQRQQLRPCTLTFTRA